MKGPRKHYGFFKSDRPKKLAQPEDAADVVVAALGMRPRGWRAEAWWEEVCVTALNAADGLVPERSPDDYDEDDLDPIGSALASVEEGPRGSPGELSAKRYEITLKVYEALNGAPVQPVQQAVMALLQQHDDPWAAMDAADAREAQRQRELDAREREAETHTLYDDLAANGVAVLGRLK